MIKGFWHIYLVNHWYSIAMDQMRVLITSGLYDHTESITIGCIGSVKQKEYLERLFVNVYDKLKIGYHSEQPTDYEFPTIRLIEQTPGNYIGYYFHTKGVTLPDDTIRNHWRAWLNEGVLNRWQQHKNNVSGAYNVSSVNFVKAPDHFSGNFWWFKRKYIDRLQKVDTMDWSYRWGAEQWICKCNGERNLMSVDFKEPGEDYFKIKIETEI